MDRKSVTGQAVVVGAGVMGAQIAAHLANAGWRATLLDIVPEGAGDDRKSRCAVAARGLERAQGAKPAAFFLPEYRDRIVFGNTTDDLTALRHADWIVEAVVEKEEIKKQVHAAIDAHAGPNAVVTTNTSALSIGGMSAACSPSYRSRFFGTHFFNPPRYMSLLELIPTPDSDRDGMDRFAQFAEVVLGKSVVIARDTPGFIANRLGVCAMQLVLHATLRHGLSVEQVDELTGPLIGHPKSASFRLSDICGLDISADVTANLKERLPAGRWTEQFVMPPAVLELLSSGRIGEKAGAGFYRREKDRSISALDWETLDYRPRKPVVFPSIEGIKSLPLPERLRALLALNDTPGRFLWETTRDILCYTAEVAPEIADDIARIDNAIKWGFNWELGPFELWDALGVRETAARIEKEGLPVPPLVLELLRAGHGSFYERSAGTTYFADINTPETLRELPANPERITLRDLKATGSAVIKQTPDATLIDLGDGVNCLEFHSKMNVLGPGTISMIDWSRDYTEKNSAALVIGNNGEHFSAGFNIQLILLSIQEQDWDEMLGNCRIMQDTLLRLKRSRVPVVAAPHGYTLGGGCEVMLHCSAAQAAAESYIGLPETGIGVIPGGGGTTELLLRAMEGVPADVDPYPFVHQAFETMGLAKISGSADEARKLGLLRDSDGVTMSTARVLFDARQHALGLASVYRPAEPGRILAMGEDGLARFDMELHIMLRAGYISEHDRLVGHELATVLCGGALVHPQLVTEEYLLEVEREAFVRLCSTPKTAERVKHMLATNKPLRN